MEIREVDSKKEKMANKHRSKGHAVLLAISILIVVSLVFWLLTYTVLFPVKQIKVTGNTVYTSEEIIDEAGLALGDKLYSISRKEIEKIIIEKLPYIKTVEFKKSILPEATLEIIVTETADTYCFEKEGVFYTTDTDNKVLSKSSVQPEGTTLVKINEKLKFKIGTTVKMKESTYKSISNIHSKLSANNYSIIYIDFTNENSVKILIDNRFIVDFGTVANLDGKVSHLNSMIEKVIIKNGKDTTGRIDLSAWTNKNQRAYYEPSNIF